LTREKHASAQRRGSEYEQLHCDLYDLLNPFRMLVIV
jgi:hypothetical protein